MPFLKPLLLASLLPLCAVASATAQGDDPALRGCWRSQQVQVTLADHSHNDQNGDCVAEYDGAKARIRCHAAPNDTDFLYRYEVISPGRLRFVALEGMPDKAKGTLSELNYSVQDDWLLVERPLTGPVPANNPGRQPVSMKSVSVRLHAGQGSCELRGPSSQRIGHSPVSSLTLTTPAGWQPWLVDPYKDRRIGAAVNTSFLIGAFIPAGAGTEPVPSRLVLVLDDVRPGPIPVRAPEFAAVKKRFAAELLPASLLCDLPDRACAAVSSPDGMLVYTELFNIKGRVAMVMSTAAQADSSTLGQLRKSVEAFVKQLRMANAQ